MLLLLLGIFVSCSAQSEGVIVETLAGSVDAGKFAYYMLSRPGRVILTLIPKGGDPDIYVGENGTQPNYNLDMHSYQSATCGLERIIVPPFALRPIGIGVYGHPSHEQSIYELRVRFDDAVNSETEFSDLQILTDEEMSDTVSEVETNRGEESWDDQEESPLISFLFTVVSFMWRILLTL